MPKRALVSGISGQDGSYLAELLLEHGYEVHGIMRRSSMPNTQRIDHIFDILHLHYGDMSDASRLAQIVKDVKPDEIYNLAAQSHVMVSYKMPEYTSDIVGMGTLRLLEAMRLESPKAKFYQASSSEMFGNRPAPQGLNTPFTPVSPYGCAKLFAHRLAEFYRREYNLWVSCGILFNHESPRRGWNFVTQKIVRGLVAIKRGKQKELKLGNLKARRDWGWAPEYVFNIYKMMQADTPSTFILGTGKSASVDDFLEICLRFFGISRSVIVFDETQVRPGEIDELRADPTITMKIPLMDIAELMCEAADGEFNDA